MRARWQRLRCKGLLGVWAVFLLMAAMLFAERSGIRTRLQRPGRSYLTGETTLTAAQVMRELPVTCLPGVQLANRWPISQQSTHPKSTATIFLNNSS